MHLQQREQRGPGLGRVQRTIDGRLVSRGQRALAQLHCPQPPQVFVAAHLAGLADQPRIGAPPRRKAGTHPLYLLDRRLVGDVALLGAGKVLEVVREHAGVGEALGRAAGDWRHV